MGSDNYSEFTTNLQAPAIGAFAITPGETDLTIYTRAIYVGGAGNLKCTLIEGSAVTFYSVPAGTVLSIRVKNVSSDSTASNLIGLY